LVFCNGTQVKIKELPWKSPILMKDLMNRISMHLNDFLNDTISTSTLPRIGIASSGGRYRSAVGTMAVVKGMSRSFDSKNSTIDE